MLLIVRILGNQSISLPSIGPSLPAVIKDSPLLLHEIDHLRKLFHQERNERLKLQSEKLRQKLDQLAPLPTFKNKADPILDALIKEGANLKKVSILFHDNFKCACQQSRRFCVQEILFTLANPQFPPVYKAKPGMGVNMWKKHFAEEKDKILSLKLRAEEFQSKVAQEAVKRQFGGYVESDFKMFPTAEMTKVHWQLIC